LECKHTAHVTLAWYLWCFDECMKGILLDVWRCMNYEWEKFSLSSNKMKHSYYNFDNLKNVWYFWCGWKTRWVNLILVFLKCSVVWHYGNLYHVEDTVAGVVLRFPGPNTRPLFKKSWLHCSKDITKGTVSRVNSCNTKDNSRSLYEKPTPKEVPMGSRSLFHKTDRLYWFYTLFLSISNYITLFKHIATQHKTEIQTISKQPITIFSSRSCS